MKASSTWRGGRGGCGGRGRCGGRGGCGKSGGCSRGRGGVLRGRGGRGGWGWRHGAIHLTRLARLAALGKVDRGERVVVDVEAAVRGNGVVGARLDKLAPVFPARAATKRVRAVGLHQASAILVEALALRVQEVVVDYRQALLPGAAAEQAIPLLVGGVGGGGGGDGGGGVRLVKEIEAGGGSDARHCKQSHAATPRCAARVVHRGGFRKQRFGMSNHRRCSRVVVGRRTRARENRAQLELLMLQAGISRVPRARAGGSER